MKKPVLERSSGASSQDRQVIRFSDELSVAEVARLLVQVQRARVASCGYGEAQGDESGAISEWQH